MGQIQSETSTQPGEKMKYADIQKLHYAGWVYCVLGLVLALTLAGCATTPPPLKGSPDLLNFLTDDQTTRTEAISTLGQPSGQFESEKILTYRLGFEPRNRSYYVVERETTANGWPTWTVAKFSLVLVFDDAGILRKHSLVKVNQ